MRLLYIFSLLLFSSVVVAEEGTINQTKIRQLAEQAWALKNSVVDNGLGINFPSSPNPSK